MAFFALTSASLLWTVVALTVACFVWTVFGVPRKRWSGARAYAQQALGVTLSALLFFSSAFVAFNRFSIWYSDWSDLFGYASDRETTTQYGSGAALATPQAKATRTPSNGASNSRKFTELQRKPLTNSALSGVSAKAPNGQWITAKIPGQGSDDDAWARVWLPPSYMDNPNKAYTVIMAFPGVPGSPKGYERPMHTDADLAAAVKSGKIRDSIIVSPNVFPHDADTECMDVQGKGIETWVTKNVVPWLKTNLRTEEGPDAWATYGYSAGAWCANMFAVRHPDLFKTSISMSGYYAPLFPSGESNQEGYVLADEVARNRPPVRIWNLSGAGDGKFRKSFDDFAPKVVSPTSLTSVEVKGSSHKWDAWTSAQPKALEWLGANAPAFSPQSGSASPQSGSTAKAPQINASTPTAKPSAKTGAPAPGPEAAKPQWEPRIREPKAENSPR